MIEQVTAIQRAILEQLKPLEAEFSLKVSSLDASQLAQPTVLRQLFVNYEGSQCQPPQYFENDSEQVCTQAWEVIAQYLEMRSTEAIYPIHAKVIALLTAFEPITREQGLLKPLFAVSDRLSGIDPTTKLFRYSLKFNCSVVRKEK